MGKRRNRGGIHSPRSPHQEVHRLRRGPKPSAQHRMHHLLTQLSLRRVRLSGNRRFVHRGPDRRRRHQLTTNPPRQLELAAAVPPNAGPPRAAGTAAATSFRPMAHVPVGRFDLRGGLLQQHLHVEKPIASLEQWSLGGRRSAHRGSNTFASRPRPGTEPLRQPPHPAASGALPQQRTNPPQSQPGEASRHPNTQSLRLLLAGPAQRCNG